MKFQAGLLFGLCLALTACSSIEPRPIETRVATATVGAFPTARPTNTPEPTPTITPTPTPELRQLTTGECCVLPAWSPDSKQVLFIDKPASQAEAGMYAVDIARSQEPQLAGRVGIYSPDRSLVAYPVDVRTIVENVASGDRWVIPNNGQALTFSPVPDPGGTVTISQVGDHISLLQFVRNEEGLWQQGMSSEVIVGP